MSEHAWFQENLSAYSADGLSVDERERFDRHRVACSACAQLLADARAFDESMDNLFAPIRPAPGFDNRVIANLRAARPRRRAFWSRGMRIAIGVAAVLVLGVLGTVLQGFMAKGNLVFPGMKSEPIASASSNLLPIKGAFVYGRDDVEEKTSSHRPEEGLVPQGASSPQAVKGRININTVWDGEVFDALTDGRVNFFPVIDDSPASVTGGSLNSPPAKGTNPQYVDVNSPQTDSKVLKTRKAPLGDLEIDALSELSGEVTLKLKVAERQLAAKAIANEEYEAAKQTRDHLFKLRLNDGGEAGAPRLPTADDNLTLFGALGRTGKVLKRLWSGG